MKINYRALVPDYVRSVGAYIQGRFPKQDEQNSLMDCAKLASNENPFGPSPKALAAVRDTLETCHLYPDNDAAELRQELARRHGVTPRQIVVAAGSTEMLAVISRTSLRPGLNAITSERSFIMYPIVTAAAGGQLLTVPMRHNGFHLDSIAAAVNSNTRLIFLANPNNPTGTAFDAWAFKRFLRKIPDTVTVILDEAYYEFAEFFARVRSVEYPRALDYIAAGRNLVVLRSFSKIYGLAGARVGYGIGPAELMGYFARMRTTFSVSIIAQRAALAALGDEKHVLKTLANNSEGAQELAQELSKARRRVIPTWANFLYCELNEDAAQVAARLESEGVIVRPLSAWGAPTAIRVTVGTPQQNERFLAAFKKVTAKRSMVKRKERVLAH